MRKLTILGVLLLIAIFGWSFTTLNRFVFNVNLSERTTQPVLVATDLILRDFDSFPIPQLTISFRDFDAPTSNAIPMEEAAIIGVRYLWEILGISLDAAEISMTFIAETDGYRNLTVGFDKAAWTGQLINEQEESEIYRFTLNAETGELMRLDKKLGIARTGYHYWVYHERWALINGKREPSEIFPDYERFQERATLLVDRFLGMEQIQSVNFLEAVPNLFSEIQNGEIIPLSYDLTFQAITSNERLILIRFDSESGEFISLINPI